MKAALLVTMIACAFSCNDGQPVQKKPPTYLEKLNDSLAKWQLDIKQAKATIKDGDLIERAGLDAISAALINFNKQDKTFSHSGIAFIENGDVYVYHSYFGKENPTGEFMREPMDSFCSPKRNKAVGIFRYGFNAAESIKFSLAIKGYFEQKIKFDTAFDLKDDKAMYCSEIIYKSLMTATNNRIVLPTTIVKDFFYKGPHLNNSKKKIFEYVALDNLYLNNNCKEVKRFSFDRLSLQDIPPQQ
jgi:hypothetical protein